MIANDAQTCYCDDEIYHCEIHVGCDDLCKALRNPQLDDAEAVSLAYEHWSSHSYLHGCSHGI